MANPKIDVSYIVLVGTNKYAGSFERAMTAYCTGEIGECEVGEEEAELFRDEVSEEIQALFNDALLKLPDEHGCHRPCEMWDSSGKNDYHEVAMFFHDEPTQQMLEVIKERAVEFSNQREYQGTMKIKSVTSIRREVTTVDHVLSVLK